MYDWALLNRGELSINTIRVSKTI